MKSTKRLLLGSATSLLMTTGVQAADMPIPEPVEYVKVCETYGIGFWYIPGTDTCIKIGGYVRAQAYIHEGHIVDDNWGSNPFAIDEDWNEVDDGFNEFVGDTFNLYTRGLVNFDTRTETSYGTLRSFVQIRGNAVDEDNPSVQLDLAFLQFAGFTAGLAPSFLDFATNAYFTDHIGDWNHDTPLFGYTHQFGGGVSFNVAIESGDRADTSAAVMFDDIYFPSRYFDDPYEAHGFGAFDINDDGLDDYETFALYAGDETRTELPDLTAAVRVNQGWGEAMLGGVLREVKGRVGLTDLTTEDSDLDLIIEGGDVSYHEIGWAIVGGLKFNTPMIAQGDYAIFRAAYGEGAARYVVQSFDLLPSGYRVGRDTAVPEVVFSGDVADETDDFETTPAWSFYAGYTHFWRPELRSTVVASYAGGDFNFDDTDWSALTASANLVWSPIKNLDIGLELLYSARDFDEGAAAVFTDDPDDDGSDDAFGAIFRVQRNFGN